MGPEDIETLNTMTLEEILGSLNPPLPTSILSLLEDFMEVPEGIFFANNTVGQVMHDWLDIDLSISEDCLHLAVSTPWRPDGAAPPADQLLPVMFFVHGGAFYAGTQIRMGADRLAAWGDVVIVAISYRVGPLGFMCLDTAEAAGNMGMLDMVVALEWVHAYIRHFGGDPDRITVFGESAGSASIGHLLLSEATNGLFAQGIGQSGSAIAPWAFDTTPELHARHIAAKVNCTQTDVDELVNCMRNVPAKDISVAFGEYRSEGRQAGGLGFGGSIPCAQTQGARKFYSADQSPESILFAGEYEQVGLAISDKKLFRGRPVDGTISLFRLFRGTENSRNSVPNRSAEDKMLGILYHGTKIEANSWNSFLNHSTEEKTTRNSVPWNKSRSKLSEFRSKAASDKNILFAGAGFFRKTNLFHVISFPSEPQN
jgi:carboxylesterase type B